MHVQEADAELSLHGSTPNGHAVNGNGTNGHKINGHPTTEASVNGKVNTSVGEELPLGSPRRLRVICIGAGATGLNLAYMLPRHLKNIEFIIYEKNEAIGGTWFENR